MRRVVYLDCDKCFSVVLFILVMEKPGWIVSASFSHGHKLGGGGRKQSVSCSLKLFRF